MVMLMTTGTTLIKIVTVVILMTTMMTIMNINVLYIPFIASNCLFVALVAEPQLIMTTMTIITTTIGIIILCFEKSGTEV